MDRKDIVQNEPPKEERLIGLDLLPPPTSTKTLLIKYLYCKKHLTK
jgi:hypothetical protein